MRLLVALLFIAVSCANTKSNTVDPRTGTTPIAAGDQGKGLSLTEGGAYGDRYDPSGWTGQSEPPKAVGGGPLPAPATSASTLPPSKDLNVTPPSKDLQL